MRDLTFTNAVLVTQDAERRVVRRGVVRVVDGEIVAVGAGSVPSRRATRDLAGRVLAPGFVNAHVHLGESAFAGRLDPLLPLEQYLAATEKLVRRHPILEERRMDIARYSALRLLQNGTTTIAGGRVWRAAEELGLRSVSGYMLMRSAKLARYAILTEEAFAAEFAGAQTTVPAIFVHSVETVTARMLTAAALLRAQHPELVVMAHVAETAKGAARVRATWKMSAVSVLDRFGLLRGALVVHGVHLTARDRARIRAAGATIVHCLSSNLRCGDGTLDLAAAHAAHIPICIATDGIATAGTFSVRAEADAAMGYHDGAISAGEALDMITRIPAAALGLPVGSIEEGKRADFIVTGDDARIRDVYVDGIARIRNGRVLSVDAPAVERAFQGIVARIS